MSIDTVEEVVTKLVGRIKPVGESNEDEKRFENLVLMCELVDRLVTKIDEVAYDNKDRYEASMKKAGLYAQNFMTNTLGINQ